MPGHVPRNPDGSAVDANTAVQAPTLFEAAASNAVEILCMQRMHVAHLAKKNREAAKSHGLATQLF